MLTSDPDVRQLIRLLEEIRDNQKMQLERQAEALALQREQFALVQKQTERAERLQNRAEALQAKGVQPVTGARKGMVVVLPIIVLSLVSERAHFSVNHRVHSPIRTRKMLADEPHRSSDPELVQARTRVRRRHHRSGYRDRRGYQHRGG